MLYRLCLFAYLCLLGVFVCLFVKAIVVLFYAYQKENAHISAIFRLFLSSLSLLFSLSLALFNFPFTCLTFLPFVQWISLIHIDEEAERMFIASDASVALVDYQEKTVSCLLFSLWDFAFSVLSSFFFFFFFFLFCLLAFLF